MPITISKLKNHTHVLRGAVPILALGLCAWLLAPHFTPQTLDTIKSQLTNTPAGTWIAALALTAVSLAAVGRYDRVAHRHFATGFSGGVASLSGTIAISLSQTVGFGLFTGAMVRWRMLHNLPFVQALQISAFVSMSFVLAWGFVAATLCIFLPSPAFVFWPALFFMLSLPVLAGVLFCFPHHDFGRFRFQLPSLRNCGALLTWTAIDTFFAGAALFMLLPADANMSFAAFLPIYLLALGTALISNTPGGLGPFELMMIALLPQMSAADVMGSIIAFRAVYYVIPALLGAIALLRPFMQTPAEPVFFDQDPFLAPNAELAVLAQNGGGFMGDASTRYGLWPTDQTATCLYDAVQGTGKNMIHHLQQLAEDTGRIPMLYKCNRRTAYTAKRELGWSALHLSDDAIIDTFAFDLDTPKLRGLRRKLRQAEKAGVRIKTDSPIPWHEMAKIDSAWQASHGAARGGTMGRFDREYLSTHFIARAYQDEQLIAYVTFQRCGREWCLDVMRHVDRVPDGTMHTLVHRAIVMARASHTRRLSLAATPACPNPNSRFFRWAARHVVSRAGGPGLRQFKSSFAPRWEPRYVAAPTSIGLTLGLMDITKNVRYPKPLNKPNINEVHNIHENNILASSRAS